MHQRSIVCPDVVSVPFSPYAPSISRRDSTRSINGFMPGSLEMASDSSSSVMAFSRSPSPSRSLRASA
ncbi:MAG: hypothetical protein J4N78_12785 [Chloroflexi bacterium]|nr:hypothetical protein [Chloroflexota bacterium]